jgi:hypothetical protein
MTLHLRRSLEQVLFDCNNFWYTYYSDYSSSNGSIEVSKSLVEPLRLNAPQVEDLILH